jgi:hypothetical protein
LWTPPWCAENAGASESARCLGLRARRRGLEGCGRDKFVACYGSGERHERRPPGQRAPPRDGGELDLFWLRDESPEDDDPGPETDREHSLYGALRSPSAASMDFQEVDAAGGTRSPSRRARVRNRPSRAGYRREPRRRVDDPDWVQEEAEVTPRKLWVYKCKLAATRGLERVFRSRWRRVGTRIRLRGSQQAHLLTGVAAERPGAGVPSRRPGGDGCLPRDALQSCEARAQRAREGLPEGTEALPGPGQAARTQADQPIAQQRACSPQWIPRGASSNLR